MSIKIAHVSDIHVRKLKYHKEYSKLGHHTLFNKLPLPLRQKYDWFLIVRNPYTRFISAYLFAYEKKMTFDTFIDIFDKKFFYECELYLQPQINFVCDNSKNIWSAGTLS